VIVASRRVVFTNAVRTASIHIEDGRIVRIDDAEADVDYGGLVISPGLVDTHVHINEPGRTEWEGFETATRAAAAGGVTTIVDMPLNSVPVTTTPNALEAKRGAARGRVHVDVAFWGGVVPGNAGELGALVDAGVRGFKCFLAPSGVDEFPMVGERDLREALPILARLGAPLLVHAESPAVLDEAARAMRQRLGDADGAWDGRQYATYAATRPPEAEVAAIDLVARLAHEFGARVHIVHVASAEAASAVARAKADGVAMTAETCPHYLTFAAADIPDGATAFKCAPPIRDASHRDALWNALDSGTLDLVATDHSPAPPSLKCTGDFLRAWGGIASLELSLAATSTAGARCRRPSDHAPEGLAILLSEWMSHAPARLAGFTPRKGRIAVGCDADLVVWDPDAEWTVDADRLEQRHKLTPYAGRRLRGAVHATYLRGACVWRDGALTAPRSGQLL